MGAETPNAVNVAIDAAYVLVMGVSGAGKSTIGKALSAKTGGSFIEADDHHSADNIRRMSNGEPLGDEHRWPWLKAIAETAKLERQRHGGPVVIACSALKRSYRDALRDVLGPMSVIHLAGPMETIRSRLESRKGHFMSTELLGSQLAILQPPGADEAGCSLSIDESEAEVVAKALRLLTAGGDGATPNGSSDGGRP